MSHYQRVDFFTIDSLRFLQSLKKRLVFLAWETNFENYTPAGQQITQAVPDIGNDSSLVHVRFYHYVLNWLTWI
jgi:hypothetical protein